MFFFININAQSSNPYNMVPSSGLDPEFLNSLPNDVRTDLMDEMSNQDAQEEKKNFRSPRTRISKDKFDINHSSLINQDFDNLKRFGDRFFNTFQSTFMPINEPSVSSDYILGIGDSVEISLLGPAPQSFKRDIERDGSISFLGLEKFYISGLPLQEAKKLLSSKIQDSFVGNDVSITLTSLRDIQVLMVGYIQTPGQYILGGNSSLIHAISMAGGISESGSYRKIKVIRGNNTIGYFDLYELLIQGNNANNIQLRSGDTVLVEPASRMVSVYGGVNRPAIYELKKDETFKELLRFAGGFNSLYSGDLISLNQATSSTENNMSFSLEDLNKKKLSPNDIVFVPYKEINMVSGIELSGNFSQSGLMSVFSATRFLANPSFSSAAYTLSFIKASYDRASNSYSLSLVNQADLAQDLKEGDKIFSMSKQDIEFINSKNFKNFLIGGQSVLHACDNLLESISYLTPETLRWTALQSSIAKNNNFLNKAGNELSDSNFQNNESNEAPFPELSNSEDLENDTFFNGPKEYCPNFVNFDKRALALMLENSIIVNNYISNEYILPISSSSLQSIVNYRGINDSNKQGYSAAVVDYNSEETNNFLSEQFDQVMISSPSAINISYEEKFLDKLVYIEGAVKKPGNYRLQDHETLYDLILRAGGYKDDAYVFGASLIRKSAQEREKQFNERVYRDIIKFLASSVRAANSISSSLPLVLEEFKNVEPIGRVQAEFSLSRIRENKNLRTSLENLDYIYIPKIPQEVFIYGEILNSGGQLYDPDLTVQDYIYLAGNTTDYSSKDIVIIDPNGKSTYYNKSRLSFLKDDLPLYPGSIIYIPREIGRINGLEYAQQLGPVFSSLALSLASLNQIFSN